MRNRKEFLFMCNWWYFVFYFCMIVSFIMTLQSPNILKAVCNVVTVVLNYILVVMRIRVFDLY